MSITTVTAKNFDEEVLRADKPVLVDFWASWCGPCRMLSPVVDELAGEHGEYKFCKVNVDEESALAQRFQVMSIPTLLSFQSGKLNRSSVGVIPKEDILGLLK